MADFTLNLFLSDSDPIYQSEHQKLIVSYQARLDEVLQKANLKGKRPDVFGPENIDIQYHPSVWSKSTRPGATTLILAAKNHTDAISSYDLLKQELMTELKALSRFKQQDRVQRKHLNEVLDDLDKLQVETNLAYMAHLRKKTAATLLAQLKDYVKDLHEAKIQAEYERLKQAVKEIENLEKGKLTTRIEALQYTDKVNQLRKTLLAFNKQYQKTHHTHISNNFTLLTRQLSIVTKRELDDTYDNPENLTNADTARKIARLVTSSIGAICGLAAFVLVFIPGGQLPAALLGMIGLAALYPVVDTVIEVTRNFWYGRSPNKAQVIELGVAVPLLAGLTIGAHFLVAIGSHFKTAIASTLHTIQNFIADKFSAIFSGALNTEATRANAADLHNADQPKLEEHIAGQPIVTMDTAMTLFHHEAKDFEEKTHLMSSADNLKSIPKGTVCYLYKKHPIANDANFDSLPTGTNNHIIGIETSYHNHIHSWRAGLFDSDEAKQIEQAVKAYADLSANESIDNRIAALEVIKAKLEKHRIASTLLIEANDKKNNYSTKSFDKLAEFVNHELTTLNKLKTANLSKVFLTHKAE